MAASGADIFEEVLQLGVARERARQARRARENSAQRLTWASSQLSQPEYAEAPPASEEAELQAFTRKLSKLLQSVDMKALSEVIVSKMSDSSFIGFMRTIMDSCKDIKTEDGATLTLAFYDAIISGYERSGDITRRTEVFDELLQKVGSLPDYSLATLVCRLLGCIAGEDSSSKVKVKDKQQASMLLGLFVKLLNRAKSLPKGSVDPRGLLKDTDNTSDASGEGFFNSIVVLLCEAKWPAELIVPLLTTLCDLSRGNASIFNREAISAIQEKVPSQLDQASKRDFAEACSLMLLLGSLQGWMKPAVSLFVEHLQSLEDDDAYPLVCGSVISRLTALVSHDIRLGSAILKHLESITDWSLTCYVILLALMRVKRFEQTAVDVIRNLALKLAQTECQELGQSPWIAQLKNLEANCNDGAETLERLSEALLTVCELARKHEWDLIIPSLVKAGLKLADEDSSFDPELPVFYDCTFAGKGNNPKASISAIGVEVLVKCYQVFAITRFELQNFIVERALISDASHGALPAIRFLYMLASKDQCTRTLFYEHATSVKDLITLLPSISPRIAHGLLRGLSRALAPGTAFPEIRDHAFLVFRKSLFQRDAESRKIGMLGFITCCRTDAQVNRGDVADEVDAMGALRRCLSQQYELRIGLYRALDGFPAQFKSNLLLSHLLNYVDQTDDRDIPPLHFDRCIESSTGVVIEPLSHLIAGFSGSNDVLTQTHIERLADADLALFSLDKDSVFDSAILQGRTNRATVTLIVETCEVFIDRLVAEAARDASESLSQSPHAGTIAALFRVMRGLRRIGWKDVAVVADNAEKGKRGRKKVAVNGKGKKQKVSDVASDDEDKDGDEDKENDRLKNYLASPPAKGAFFTDTTLTLLLKTMSSVTANVLLESLANPQKSGRRDFMGLISNLSTHEFVIEALHVRMFELQRIAGGLKGYEKLTNAVDSLVATTQFTSMAESCAGIEPPVVDDITPEMARLIYKQFKRYLSAEKLSGNGSSQTSESRTDKSLSGTDSPNGPTFQSLWVKALEVLRDIISVAERTSLKALTCTLSAITEWMPKGDAASAPSDGEDEDVINDRLLHSSASAVLDMVESDMSWRDLRAVSALLGILGCLISRVSSKQANIEKMTAHAMRVKDILRFNDGSRQLPLVKQMVKVYLDLSVRASEFDFSPSFIALVSASSATLERATLSLTKKSKKQPREDEEVMDVEADVDPASKIWSMLRTPNCATAAITVVLQGLCTHGLDECERMLSASSLVINSSKAQALWVGRILAVMKVLAELLGAASHKTAIGDPILRCAVRTYKCLTRFLRRVTSRKDVTSADSLASLVRFCSENIVGKLDSCLQRLEESSSGGKVAPEVVFALEQYEVVLLKAAKACSSISTLGKYAKRLTARDFKFHPERLKHALATKEEKGEGASNDQEEEEEE